MMTGFKKAKPEQVALKLGLYGPAGSGKTYTSLKFAEGLAALAGGKVALVDTERGSDFYAQAVPDRLDHPAAFEFDAIYPPEARSLRDVLRLVTALDPKEYKVVIIDSITHLWESAREAYKGKETSAGTIPFHQWGKIKKPYKELINFLLSSTMHVILCGRQGNEYGSDEESGELKMTGVKMKAESETPFEPNILIRMTPEKVKGKAPIIKAFAEKDRTGMLYSKIFVNPSFDNMIKPLLPLLSGKTQAPMEAVEDVAQRDQVEIQEDEANKAKLSKENKDRLEAGMTLATTEEELDKVAKEITPLLKKSMVPADVTALKEKFTAKLQEIRREGK